MGLTRLITSSPCSTSLRMWDTIRCLAKSKSSCLALASRTQVWYSASASCTWRNQGHVWEKAQGRGHRSTVGAHSGVPTLAWASSRERRRRSCCLVCPGEAWGAWSSGDAWERTHRSSLRCTYWSWARRSDCIVSFWGQGRSTVRISVPSSPPLACPHPPWASPYASAPSSTAL